MVLLFALRRSSWNNHGSGKWHPQTMIVLLTIISGFPIPCELPTDKQTYKLISAKLCGSTMSWWPNFLGFNHNEPMRGRIGITISFLTSGRSWLSRLGSHFYFWVDQLLCAWLCHGIQGLGSNILVWWSFGMIQLQIGSLLHPRIPLRIYFCWVLDTIRPKKVDHWTYQIITRTMLGHPGNEAVCSTGRAFGLRDPCHWTLGDLRKVAWRHGFDRQNGGFTKQELRLRRQQIQTWGLWSMKWRISSTLMIIGCLRMAIPPTIRGILNIIFPPCDGMELQILIQPHMHRPTEDIRNKVSLMVGKRLDQRFCSR